MMYLYMILTDNTKITHSQILQANIAKLYIETPKILID